MDRQYPGEKVWRFDFHEEHSLGDDLVAIAKGKGLFKVHELDGLCLVDGHEAQATEGTFHESFSATRSSGRSRIELHIGRTEPLNPVFWPIPPQVQEFSGWMLAPGGWSFLEPVYTFEALDKSKPVGAPGLHACYTLNSFFLQNEQARANVGWHSPELAGFYEVEDFPAPFVHHDSASFRIDVPEDNDGVQIARFLDAQSGPQRAMVIVNGQEAGEWFYPFQDAANRVQADLFGLPLGLTKGQTRLEIQIQPLGTWASAWYGVDALLPRLQ